MIIRWGWAEIGKLQRDEDQWGSLGYNREIDREVRMYLMIISCYNSFYIQSECIKQILIK